MIRFSHFEDWQLQYPYTFIILKEQHEMCWFSVNNSLKFHWLKKTLNKAHQLYVISLYFYNFFLLLFLFLKLDICSPHSLPYNEQLGIWELWWRFSANNDLKTQKTWITVQPPFTFIIWKRATWDFKAVAKIFYE